MVNQQKTNNSLKNRHTVTVSDEGWEGVKNVAEGLELSVSELLEKIGSGELAVLDDDEIERENNPEIIYNINGASAFDKIYDEVISSGEPVVVAREGYRSISVMLTSELNSILETLYLFQSPKNGARILEAVKRAEKRVIEPKTIEELREEVGIGEEE